MLTEKEITSRYYTTKLGKLIQKFGLSRIYFKNITQNVYVILVFESDFSAWKEKS